MIKVRAKFPEVSGLDVELVSLVKQIEEAFCKTDDQRLETEHGELYTDSAIVTTIGVISTYYQLTGLTTGHTKGMSISNSEFVIDRDGVYLVNVSSSFTHSINNTIVHFSIFVDDIEDTTIEAERKIGTAGDYGNAGISGILNLKVGQRVGLRYKCDKTGNVTTNHFNMNIVEL